MTIFRGRWQEHLKSRGEYYPKLAAELEAIHERNPEVGALTAAYALRALGRILEECRLSKLTRNQYVTFQVGDLISLAETSWAFCKSAASEPYSESVVFDKEVWQAMSRIHARETALRILSEGMRLVIGSEGGDPAAFAASLGAAQIYGAEAGLVADMDLVANKLNETFKAE